VDALPAHTPLAMRRRRKRGNHQTDHGEAVGDVREELCGLPGCEQASYATAEEQATRAPR